MNTKIKTSRLEYYIDKKRFMEKYDVFYLETSDKYIKRGAYVLDATVLCNDIKAIKFESGKKLLIMMYKDTSNRDRLKTVMTRIENGDKYSISSVPIENVPDYCIVQLLLNAMGSCDSEFLKYNNLTGHLYCFHPNWIKHGKKDKEDLIWSVPCVELSITPSMCLNLAVRTFTSELLRKRITFAKKKFEDYPKYIFAANNMLRRRLDGEKETCFILRQVDGIKTEIEFLNLQNSKKYEQSKMGILNNIINTFNLKYEGICELEFKSEAISQKLDYSKVVQRENLRRIKGMLDETGIHIVDQIEDKYSRIFCEKIKCLLDTKYGIDSTIGKRVNKDKMNIVVIHNAAYYEGINDPHDKNYNGVAVQHITFEDFSDSSEFALATVIHEILIKKDLQEKQISLFDWGALKMEGNISFGIEKEIDGINRYFFMTVNPDGAFEIKEQENTLFEINEYTKLVDIFEQARTNSETVMGIIKFEDGSINVIKDSGLFTIPEIDVIGALLENGDNKLRGKMRREELLSSCLDIKMYEADGKSYYCVGTIGEGMRQNIRRAAVIRKLEGYDGSPVWFEKLLPMMNVSFVRNGQLTVVPFPFKYLREYLLAESKSKLSK